MIQENGGTLHMPEGCLAGTGSGERDKASMKQRRPPGRGDPRGMAQLSCSWSLLLGRRLLAADFV